MSTFCLLVVRRRLALPTLRMEAFTRHLLYPTITTIVIGLEASERLWFTKQSILAADASLPEVQRGIHSGKAIHSRTKLSVMEALAAAPGELYQASQSAFGFFDVNGSLDATARPTDRAEKGNKGLRTEIGVVFAQGLCQRCSQLRL